MWFTVRAAARRLFSKVGVVVIRSRAWEGLRREGSPEGMRTRARIAHPPVHGLPNVELEEVPAIGGPRRLPIAERLIRAYRRALSDVPDPRFRAAAPDLWAQVATTDFTDLQAILARGDAPELAEYLMSFGSTYTPFGGFTLSVDGYTPTRDRRDVAFLYHDCLVSLAEGAGGLCPESPELGAWGVNLYQPVDELIARLEAALGFSVSPPEGVTHALGIKTSRGVFHYRHLNAIYAASRVKALVNAGDAVCEYGGGLGIAAFYAARMGLNDYTLYDLPFGNVFAGHYLLNALGEDKVTLHGEAPSMNAIKVLPYWACAEAPSKVYRLTMNQDSFPEVDAQLVREFLGEVARTTRSFFLSINQESRAFMSADRKQLPVPELLRDHPAYRRLYRGKYWLRPGYVEELYRLVHDQPAC